MLTPVLQTYPQPIAYAYGNVYRTRSQLEKLNQILRCAEVTTRYLSALAIASFAAREDASISPPPAFTQFRGNLSFGHFHSIVEAVSYLKISHPLQKFFSQSLASKKNPTKDKLKSLLELRNKVSHDIKSLDESSAIIILKSEDTTPLESLEQVLEGIVNLCSLPLFLVDAQKPVRRVNHIVRLLLMGEQSVPMPEEVAVSDVFMDDKKLYVGINEGALLVYPMLVWGLECDRAAQSIYLIDKVTSNQLSYKSLAAFNQPKTPPIPDELLQVLTGKIVPVERITFYDGRSFVDAWQEKREMNLLGKANITRNIQWTELDQPTLQWYCNILKHRFGSDTLQVQNVKIEWHKSSEVIRQLLFDGRGEVTLEELFQLTLLFGKPIEIRRKVGRDILDLRARKNLESRWDERQEIGENVLQALCKALEFIGRHNPLLEEELSTDNLQTTIGSADYIAVREALINLIIHQDYSDQRTVAQIELEPNITIMVNAGASLVSEEHLIKGGTSTARNPVVARALKLIGYAELGGSGLREVYRVWRNAKRRPPVVKSEEQYNRFRIQLDSRPLKEIADSFWKKRLGVSVNPEQAKILGLLGNFSSGMTLAEISLGIGATSEESLEMCQYLQRQSLIDCEAEVYSLKSYLQDLAKEAIKATQEPSEME